VLFSFSAYSFGNSSNVQKTLTDSLKEVIEVYGFSGFVIDFQNIPPSGDNAKNLYRFIKNLSEKTATQSSYIGDLAF